MGEPFHLPEPVVPAEKPDYSSEALGTCLVRYALEFNTQQGQLTKLRVIGHVSPPRTWESEAGGLRVQGHPQLHEFKTNLSYVRSHLKKTSTKKERGDQEEGGEGKAKTAEAAATLYLQDFQGGWSGTGR